MPQLAPITVSDGSDPHTFAPRAGVDASGTAILVESTGVPVADRRLMVQRSRTTAGREQVSLKLTLPVVQNQTVNGIVSPSIVRTAYIDVKMSFADTSDKAERTKARAIMTNVLGDAIMGKIADDLEYLF